LSVESGVVEGEGEGWRIEWIVLRDAVVGKRKPPPSPEPGNGMEWNGILNPKPSPSPKSGNGMGLNGIKWDSHHLARTGPLWSEG